MGRYDLILFGNMRCILEFVSQSGYTVSSGILSIHFAISALLDSPPKS